MLPAARTEPLRTTVDPRLPEDWRLTDSRAMRRRRRRRRRPRTTSVGTSVSVTPLVRVVLPISIDAICFAGQSDVVGALALTLSASCVPHVRKPLRMWPRLRASYRRACTLGQVYIGEAICLSFDVTWRVPYHASCRAEALARCRSQGQRRCALGQRLPAEGRARGSLHRRCRRRQRRRHHRARSSPMSFPR